MLVDSQNLIVQRKVLQVLQVQKKIVTVTEIAPDIKSVFEDNARILGTDQAMNEVGLHVFLHHPGGDVTILRIVIEMKNVYMVGVKI